MLAASIALLACREPTGTGTGVSIESRCATSGGQALPWQLANPARNHEIEGYASAPSVDRGGSIALYVNTVDPSYTIEVYRMGWYGGAGAAAMMAPVTLEGIHQPPPVIDRATGLIQCPWRDPYVLAVPSGWPSGIYLAKLTGASGRDSYIIFVVRDDASTSDFLVQVSMSTYEAYNDWGGRSLYAFNSTGTLGGVARKVSFDRPYAASSDPGAACGAGAGEFLTNYQPSAASRAGWEYDMVRFLEREGYDVTYTTDVDVHERPSLLLNHKAFLVVGHDEYWSGEQRQAVIRARDAGVDLGFFASNVAYWQVRYEPSTISGARDRTMVGYKESAIRLDPDAIHGDRAHHSLVTERFRDLGMPESQFIGVMYGYSPVDGDIAIDNDTTWVTAGTELARGSRLHGLLGYEVDHMYASSPPDILRIGHSYIPSRHRYSDMTIYTAASGALVFATGSMQWSWGLDDYGAPGLRPLLLSTAAQGITRNVLDRFRLGGASARRGSRAR